MGRASRIGERKAGIGGIPLVGNVPARCRHSVLELDASETGIRTATHMIAFDEVEDGQWHAHDPGEDGKGVAFGDAEM